MTDKTEKPEAEKPASKPVYLLLSKPVSGLVAGRVVTASEERATQLKKSNSAKTPTEKQIRIAGGAIPHIPD